METDHACLPTAVYRFKVPANEIQSWVSLLLSLLRIIYLLLLLLHHLLLLKLYSLLWILVSNTIFLHSTLFLPIVCSFISPIIYTLFNLVPPSFTRSSPFSLFPPSVAIRLGILWSCNLSTWQYHLCPRDFVHFKLSVSCDESCISLFVLTLQRSSDFRLHTFSFQPAVLSWLASSADFSRLLTCKSL